MKAGAFAEVMAALGRVAKSMEQERAGDFARSLARLATNDAIEARDAVCVKCGAVTPGLWQHVPGGRRIRTPLTHDIRAGVACEGSFVAADLRERTANGETKQ